MKGNIHQLLRLRKCSVLQNFVELNRDGNSEFAVLPIVHLQRLFADFSNVQASATFVHINGHSEEPLHMHLSQIVVAIINGSGYLLTKNEGRIKVSKGDLIVIPKRVKHEFVCDKGTQMSYFGYEISNTRLDFKKHF